MSGEGKQILESTRNFQNYLENIGKLLSTTEALLNKLGYKIAYDRTAIVVEAISIDKPQKWLPQVVFRFLQHKENSHILVCISVIIDDLTEPELFEQPMISVLWCDYGKGNVIKKGEERSSKISRNTWIYKFSKLILRVKSTNLEGPMNDIFPELKDYFDEFGILASQALAVPLVDIQTERDIEEKIISPLVESLNGVIN